MTCLHTTMDSTSRLRIKEIIDPSHPLLEAKRSDIQSCRVKTFSYGQLERHQLEVYYPPPTDRTTTKSNPTILRFYYGGGFTRGSRSFPPNHLVYNNVGAFFASRGIVTVIPDYRLVPNVKWPGGAEDIYQDMSTQSAH